MSDWHDLDLLAGDLEQSAEKIRLGDIRGARVRIEEVCAVVQIIEQKECNADGKLSVAAVDARRGKGGA